MNQTPTAERKDTENEAPQTQNTPRPSGQGAPKLQTFLTRLHFPPETAYRPPAAVKGRDERQKTPPLTHAPGRPVRTPFVLTRAKCRFQKVFKSRDKRRYAKRRETLTRGEADAGNRREGEDAATLGGEPFMAVACGMFEDRRNRFIR